MNLSKIFRDNLNRLCKEGRLTNEYLSSVSGYSESYIRRVRAGRQGNPTLQFVACISDSIGVTIEELLEE